MRLLDEPEYFKIMNSECCLGKIAWPGPLIFWPGPGRPVCLREFLDLVLPSLRAAWPVQTSGRHVHPSVCLCVTRRYCVKTTQAKSRNLHHRIPQDTSGVYLYKVHPEIRNGSPRARLLNVSGSGKIRDFPPLSRRASKRCKDRIKFATDH